jgi:hypothetical protein
MTTSPNNKGDILQRMKDELPTFSKTLDRITALFRSVSEELAAIKPRSEDWSVKEIVCHLIDSASNNHQRFTRLQRTTRLEFPAYEPEPWVTVEKSFTTAVDRGACGGF